MNTNFPCGRMSRPASSRRDFLRTTSLGFGSLALTSMLAEQAIAANPLAPKEPHFPAKAKRVIMLFMEGGPSQMDTIDYKPELIARHDQAIPPSATPLAIRQGKGEKLENFGSLYRPVSEFKQRGESGLWMSDALENIAQHADDLCILNGMVCDSTEHGTATQQFHTGMPVLPRPSMGAWLMYGLGTENQNMPGFVVISPPAGSNMNCGTDFLPGIYQSTILRDAEKAGSDKIRYLMDKRLPRSMRRSQLDFLQDLNTDHAMRSGNEPNLESMIEANELAFRMQAEAPEVFDIESETAETQAMYGIGEKATDSFGRQCLLARRLAEADVRFIQVTSKQWDHHDTIGKLLPESCQKVDKPIAGLLADLKARGLLEDTLVIWSGEFGRTPVYQKVGGISKKGKPPGRGHNPFGWSLFMAGGGVKPGFKYGATDEFGYSAIEGRVHIHDFHATVLHLLGLDHERLTYMHAGRPYRLTDVYGNVVKEIVA
ncbi:hypothetical protein Poly51_39270 [Rubripirellula tenax]|uniref:Sulfatase n=1 Tax=Rubripirellula tenax TaxID=2528015 RepID=A0A5C6EQI4_9BACT|nr:DUF1501 domain-containing protein [Rubripirellula tenax]TWU50634.1 hypothetical protein Poly51_39270 [Rubripirellula tenax]